MYAQPQYQPQPPDQYQYAMQQPNASVPYRQQYPQYPQQPYSGEYYQQPYGQYPEPQTNMRFSAPAVRQADFPEFSVNGKPVGAPYSSNINLLMRSVLLSNIPFEDFFNQGVLALIDCIERYDPDRGASFDTYSYLGIRGSILKYLRKQNWLPNRVWEARKKIAQGRSELEQRLMFTPSSE